MFCYIRKEIRLNEWKPVGTGRKYDVIGPVRAAKITIILFPSEISNFVIKSIVIYSYSYIGVSVIFISPYSTYRDSSFR
jgi:hypothetical protein